MDFSGLTGLSTELYMIMYVLMFLAAIKLHHKHVDRPKVFKIPGGTRGMWITACIGLVGRLATIVVSFRPLTTSTEARQPDIFRIYAWAI
jgi:prolipoprotein diacylglyceryltransferase